MKLFICLLLVFNTAFAKDPQGFKFSQIKKGGVYDKLGLKNDDILLKINSAAPKSIEELTDVLKKTPPGGVIKLELFRNGKTEILTYHIK